MKIIWLIGVLFLFNILFLWVLKFPFRAFLIFILTLPLEATLVIEAGFTIRPSYIALLFIIPVVLIYRGRIGSFKSPFNLYVFVYIIVVFLSLGMTVFFPPPEVTLDETMKYRGVSFRGIIQFFLLIFFTFGYFLTIYFCSHKKRLFKALNVYVGVVLILSLYGIYQFFAVCFGLPFVDITNALGTGGSVYSYYDNPIFFRSHATFQEPLIFGNYLLSVVPFLLTIYLYRNKVGTVKDTSDNLLYSKLIPIVIMFIALFSTKSVSAWIGCFCACLFLLLFAKEVKYKFKIVSMLVATVIVIGFLIVFYLPDYENVINVIFLERQVSFDTRLSYWSYIFDLWKQYPILGVGIGNYGFYSAQFFGHSLLGTANGVFWQALVETGILGFFAFCFLVFYYYKILFKTLKNVKDTLWYPYILGYLAGFTGMMVQYISFGDRLNMYVWFFIGISMATVKLIKKEQNI